MLPGGAVEVHRPVGSSKARAQPACTAHPEAVLLLTPATWRRRTIRRLDAIVYRLIDHRRGSQDDGADLLLLLLQARYEDGSRMSPRQLCDRAVTFFLGAGLTNHRRENYARWRG